jgi:hypothetical protein
VSHTSSHHLQNLKIDEALDEVLILRGRGRKRIPVFRVLTLHNFLMAQDVSMERSAVIFRGENVQECKLECLKFTDDGA